MRFMGTVSGQGSRLKPLARYAGAGHRSRFIYLRRQARLRRFLGPIRGCGLLGESQFLAEVQCRYGGIPKPVIEDAELRALLVPTLRADVNLLETCTYEAEHPLECRITVLGGGADRIVTREVLEPWREQTLSGSTFHLLEGDHFFLQSDRARLLTLISQELARSCAGRTPHGTSPS